MAQIEKTQIEKIKAGIEDERIRKTLIHIVKGACDKYGIKCKGDDITEEKQLLLKELCARLPYGVIVQFEGWNPEKLSEVDLNTNVYNGMGGLPLPYLRPMSSMTEEERLVYEQRFHDVGRSIDVIDADDVASHIDWLLSHHFDFRGLIYLGLALEAPEGMYKNE